MRSSDKTEIVLMVEGADDVGAEKEASATRRQTPAVNFVGIGPEEIAHCAFVRDFLFAVYESNLIYRVDERRQSTVNT